MRRSPLLHFLILGALLFGLQSFWGREAEPTTIRVKRSEVETRLAAYQRQMGRIPTDAEAAALERQVVDEAIWLEEAFRLGLEKYDPVVQQRLLLNMRFLEGEGASGSASSKSATPASNPGPGPESTEGPSEAELLGRAFELGMHRSDTVVQRRLIDRMQALIRARVRSQGVPPETLAAYYADSAERWREPELFDFTHVYVSRDKHGNAARERAEVLRDELRQESLGPEGGILRGDPFLSGHRLRGASPQRIATRLGPTFLAGPVPLADAPIGEWVGPFDSAFGSHVVWIHEREPSRIPELSEVEDRVREDYFESRSREEIRAHLDQRREQLAVVFVDAA